MGLCDHPQCHLQKKGEILCFVLFCCCSLWQESSCLVATATEETTMAAASIGQFYIYKIILTSYAHLVDPVHLVPL